MIWEGIVYDVYVEFKKNVFSWAQSWHNPEPRPFILNSEQTTIISFHCPGCFATLTETNVAAQVGHQKRQTSRILGSIALTLTVLDHLELNSRHQTYLECSSTGLWIRICIYTITSQIGSQLNLMLWTTWIATIGVYGLRSLARLPRNKYTTYAT